MVSLTAQGQEGDGIDAYLEEFAQPEDPLALFQAGLKDVDLDLGGSWTTSIGYGLVFPVGDGSSDNLTLEGQEGQAWTNAAELQLTLRYLDRFFFRTEFLDTFSRNSILFGYDGTDTETVREWRLGNNAIGWEDGKLLSFSTAPAALPGTHLVLENGPARFSALARISSTATQTEWFQGNSPLESLDMAGNAWLQGRFFRIPVSDADTVTVWVESASGTLASDGSRYKSLTASEILLFHPAEGLVGLASRPSGKVLIAWTGASGSSNRSFADLSDRGTMDPGSPVAWGDADFSSRVVAPLRDTWGWPLSDDDPASLMVTIDGSQALRVRIPGLFSPFEDKSWYSVPSGSTVADLLVDGKETSTFFSQSGTVVRILPDSGDAGIAGASFPLSGLIGVAPYLPGKHVPDDGIPAIHMTLGSSDDSEATSELTLEYPAIESSIQVYRNGSPSLSYRYDSDTHAIDLHPAPGTGEIIKVVYDRLDEDGDPDMLQLAMAGSLEALPGTKVSLALGLDWPVTADALENGTGTLSAGLGLKHSSGPFSLETRLKGYWAIPNPSGVRTIQNFSSSKLSLLTGSSTFFASALPPALSAFGTTAFSEDTRALPVWMESDPDSTALGWDEDGAETQAGGTTPKAGPYLRNTISSDGFTSSVMVIKVEPVPGRTWTAVELRLSDDQLSALQETGSAGFRVRDLAGDSNAGKAWLVAGPLSEDADGDGSLAEWSSTHAGTVLSHTSWDHDIVQPATAGTPGARGEDRNDDGLMEDGSLESLIFPVALDDSEIGGTTDTPFPSGSWTTLLWAPGAAGLRSLAASRTLSFIVATDDSTTGLSGRWGIAEIQCDIPRLQVSEDSPDDVSAATTSDSVRAAALRTAFPDLSGTDTRLGRLHFVLPAGESASIIQYVGSRALADGTCIDVHLLAENTLPDDLELEIRNGDTVVASGTLDLSSSTGTWVRITLDAGTGTISAANGDGTVLASSTLAIIGGTDTWDRILFSLGNPGATEDSATVYADEIQTRKALSRLGGTGYGRMNLDWKGPLVSLPDGTPLLSDLSLEAEGSFDALMLGGSAAFSTDTASLNDRVALRTSATLPGLKVSGGAWLQDPGDDASDGMDYALSLQLPAGIPFGATHSYSVDRSDGTASRNEGSLFVGIKDLARLDATWSGGASTEGLRDVRWGGTLTLGIPGLLTGTAKAILSQTCPDPWPDTEPWTATWLGLVTGDPQDLYTRDILLAPALTLKGPAMESLFEASCRLVRQTSGTVTDKGSLSATVTLGDEASPMHLVGTYTRTAEAVSTPGSDLLYDDLSMAVTPFSSWPSFLLSLPVEEFWEADLPQRFADDMTGHSRGTLAQEAGLSASRPQDTSLLALGLPKTATIKARRQVDWLPGSTGDQLALYWQLGWSALNLLGDTGTARISDAWGTDALDCRFGMVHQWEEQEYDASLAFGTVDIKLWGLSFGDALNKGWKSRRNDLSGLLEVQDIASLNLGGGVYTNESTSCLSATGSLTVAWGAMLPPWKPEVFGRTPTSDAWLHHMTSLSMASTRGEDQEGTEFLLEMAGAGTYTSYGLIADLSHTVTLVLPGIACLSLEVGAGFGDIDEYNLSNLGIHAKLSAKIKW